MANIPFLNNAYFSAKVGIGTDGPAYKLDVNSSASVGARIESTGSGYAPASILLEAGGNDARGQGIYQYNIASKNSWFSGVPYSTTSDDWVIAHKLETTAFNSDVAQMSNALFCVNDNGNVGIGTTSPSANLDILNGTTGASLKLSATATAYWQLQRNSTTGNLNISDDALGNVMSFDQLTGNVGIGTDSPGVNFQVGDGTTDTSSRFYHSDNTYTQVSGYGLFLSRLSSYIRPVFDGTQDLYFGNINLTWKTIQFDATTITFDNNSSEAMRITSTGNVGIGTTSPGAKLDIHYFTAGGNDDLLNIGLDASNPTRAKIYTENYDGNFGLWNSGSTQQVKVSSDGDSYFNGGNVGIGTDSPGAKLEVAGDILINSGEYISWGTVGATSIEGSTASNKLQFRTNSSDRMIIDSSGNVGIGTTSPDNILHVRNGDTGYASQVGADTMLILETTNVSNSLQFSSTTSGNQYIMFGDDDPNAGWIAYAHSDNSFSFRTNGAERMRIATDGAIQFNDYGAGTLVSDASGNITVSSGGGAGGPYLPLSAGSGFPLTNTLFLGSTQNNSNEYNWLVFNNQASGYGDWNIYKLGNNNLAFGYGITAGASYNNALTLEYNGNVGIGTTDPSQKLEVSKSNYNVSKFVGNTDNETGYVGAVLEIETNNDDRGRGVYLTHRNAADTSDSEWYAGVPYAGGGYSIGNAVYATSIDSAAGPAHKDQSKLFIENTGKVGIGTTTPNEKLDVAGKVYIESQGVDWNETTPGLTRGALHFDPVGDGAADTGNAITFGASDASNGTNGHAGIYTRSDGAYGTKMYFATTDSYSLGSKTRMMIDYNGNVGIGTTSPSSKLQVAGGIQMADDTATASAAKVGTLKYRVSGNNSYVDMCMQTGATTYAWINIVQNNW